MFKVHYKGSVLTLKETAENIDLIKSMIESAKENCERIEIRLYRLRMIYYFDYDKNS